jgi:hypothetical protein
MRDRMWLAEELEKARTMRDCFKRALEEVLEFSNDPAVIRIAREALGTKTAQETENANE